MLYCFLFFCGVVFAIAIVTKVVNKLTISSIKWLFFFSFVNLFMLVVKNALTDSLYSAVFLYLRIYNVLRLPTAWFFGGGGGCWKF